LDDPLWCRFLRQGARTGLDPELAGLAEHALAQEIDRELLERLRKRRPEKSDRELVESVARIQLGREASARVKERFAGVASEEIEREAVKAVREVRHEMAAEQRPG
jgi:hypothetical protein